MKIKDQIYKIVDHRIKTICQSEYKKALGKKRKLTKPLMYPIEVKEMTGYLSELCDCSIDRAMEIYSIVTQGEINHQFLKAI